MRESDSKCCGECSTGECGNLDELAASRAGILACQTRILALESELAEAQREYEGPMSEEIQALTKDRDEAHAAIRDMNDVLVLFLHPFGDEEPPCAACRVAKKHAAVIRRAMGEGK